MRDLIRLIVAIMNMIYAVLIFLAVRKKKLKYAIAALGVSSFNIGLLAGENMRQIHNIIQGTEEE